VLTNIIAARWRQDPLAFLLLRASRPVTAERLARLLDLAAGGDQLQGQVAAVQDLDEDPLDLGQLLLHHAAALDVRLRDIVRQI